MTAHSQSSPSSENDDLDFAILERYWIGEPSIEEASTVEAWFAAHPESWARYEQLRRGLTAGSWVPLPLDDVARTLTNVLAATGIQDEIPAAGTRALEEIPQVAQGTSEGEVAQPTGRRISPPRIARSVWSVAAACLVGLVLLAVGWRSGTKHVNTNLASHASVYTTAEGKQATIELPDGSTVVLNVASQLEVPSDFATGNRTLKLRGEAFFRVTHQTGIPFTVVAGSSVTRVLGTSFLVRHYATDTSAIIAVRDGKVAVQSTILTAHQQVAVGEKGMSAVRSVSSSRFGFATGTMTLSHVQLRNAIPDLNRWYDADIRIADPQLDAREFTIECGNESLSDLVNILELTLGIRVERNGRVLTLFSK